MYTNKVMGNTVTFSKDVDRLSLYTGPERSQNTNGITHLTLSGKHTFHDVYYPSTKQDNNPLVIQLLLRQDKWNERLQNNVVKCIGHRIVAAHVKTLPKGSFVFKGVKINHLFPKYFDGGDWYTNRKYSKEGKKEETTWFGDLKTATSYSFNRRPKTEETKIMTFVAASDLNLFDITSLENLRLLHTAWEKKIIDPPPDTISLKTMMRKKTVHGKIYVLPKERKQRESAFSDHDLTEHEFKRENFYAPFGVLSFAIGYRGFGTKASELKRTSVDDEDLLLFQWLCASLHKLYCDQIHGYVFLRDGRTGKQFHPEFALFDVTQKQTGIESLPADSTLTSTTFQKLTCNISKFETADPILKNSVGVPLMKTIPLEFYSIPMEKQKGMKDPEYSQMQEDLYLKKIIPKQENYLWFAVQDGKKIVAMGHLDDIRPEAMLHLNPDLFTYLEENTTLSTKAFSFFSTIKSQPDYATKSYFDALMAALM